MLLALLISAESSLGRIEIASLSQQTLMELFVEGFINKEAVCDTKHAPLPELSSWNKLTLDELDNVTQINWGYIGLNGTVSLQWIPSTVVKLRLNSNNLKGEIAVGALPTEIRQCDFSYNAFSGQIQLDRLPRRIEDLSTSRNKLSGKLELTRLPEPLLKLNLSHNLFCGSADLTCLPRRMIILSLHGNQLSGSLDLTRLPDCIKEIYLDNNEFFGEIDLSHLPSSLTVFDISKTRLTGELSGEIASSKTMFTLNEGVKRSDSIEK